MKNVEIVLNYTEKMMATAHQRITDFKNFKFQLKQDGFEVVVGFSCPLACSLQNELFLTCKESEKLGFYLD